MFYICSNLNRCRNIIAAHGRVITTHLTGINFQSPSAVRQNGDVKSVTGRTKYGFSAYLTVGGEMKISYG